MIIPVSPAISYRLTAVLLLATLCLATNALAVPRYVASDKDLKFPDPIPQPTGVIFDCTARDTLLLAPDVTLTRQDDTTDAASNLPGYGCNSWPQDSPEHIYRLDVTDDLELWAALGNLNGVDLDLILLNDCDTDSCLVMANLELSAFLTSGTYYLIVDGYSEKEVQFGPYTLDISCRWPGLPEAACLVDPGNKVICAAETLTYAENLFGKPNLVQSYSCSPIIERGGEVWYELTLPGYHEVNTTLTSVPETLDVALWIFAGCGPQAQCLGFADDRLAGSTEELSLVNNDAQPLTVYLAVDSYRPVTSAEGGDFTIDFQCQSNVADQKTSFGSLRSIYR